MCQKKQRSLQTWITKWMWKCYWVCHVLEVVHNLIKYNQLHDVFMCDFIALMKIYLVDVYNLYSNPSTFFKCHVFHNFTSLVNQKHESIVMKWIINLATMIDHMVFECFKQHILAKHQNMTTNA
jgi:hypothetical protein